VNIFIKHTDSTDYSDLWDRNRDNIWVKIFFFSFLQSLLWLLFQLFIKVILLPLSLVLMEYKHLHNELKLPQAKNRKLDFCSWEVEAVEVHG